MSIRNFTIGTELFWISHCFKSFRKLKVNNCQIIPMEVIFWMNKAISLSNFLQWILTKVIAHSHFNYSVSDLQCILTYQMHLAPSSCRINFHPAQKIAYDSVTTWLIIFSKQQKKCMLMADSDIDWWHFAIHPLRPNKER